MKKFILYTDGACSRNPGPGGWGCVLQHRNNIRELSGYNPDTTNNQMEIVAVIEGLKAIEEPSIVEVYSDSAYVVNAFEQGWIKKWLKNGWKTSEKKPVKNIRLWKALLELMNKHKVTLNKVTGHSGVELNERSDALATGEIEKNKPND